eukprot:13675897-Heterocapsa_arctica.AAC.1
MPDDAVLHELPRGKRVDALPATLRRRVVAQATTRGKVILPEVVVRVNGRTDPRGQGERYRRR